MKKCLVMSVVPLFTWLFSFASVASVSHQQPGKSSQFGLNRSRLSHAASSRIVAHPHGIPITLPSNRSRSMVESSAKATLNAAGRVHSAGRLHALTGSSPASVSFLAGARTPLGGEDDNLTAAVMGDFNGDGKPDVAKVVSNVISSTQTFQVAVLLGNGDGTFKTAVVTATDGNSDDPIVVGALKGTTTDDIIQVHPTGDNCDRPQPNAIHLQPMTLPSCGSSMDVMISNGDGTFATPVNYPISGAGLIGGLLTDINGDGKLDVLVFDDSTPANVIELLGNGDGTFQAANTLGHLTTSAPSNMIFADFNGDGKIDFAGELESGQIQVTLATGAGIYANPPVSLTTYNGAYDTCGTATGDLSGDTKPEIVSFNCNVNTVTIYLNQGDGSFATGLDYDNNGARDQNIEQGVIADVNGDGKNDIVAININTADISVFLGNGDGTVAVQPLRYAAGGYAYEAPLVADFNGDGLLDVVEADDLYNLVYLQGYGGGAFHAVPTYSLPNSFNQRPETDSVATGDFNGDGIPDVVVGEFGNGGSTGVTVYLGNGDGTFQTGVSYGPSDSMTGVVVADFNGDKKLDIAAVDVNNQVVQIFLGNGDGTFSVGGVFASDTVSEPGPNTIAVGDFNKDGKPDLAVSNANSRDVGVLLGNGDGTFATAVAYAAGAGYSPQSINAVDINGDGFLDLEVPSVNDDTPGVVIFLGKNDSSGTFEAASYVALHGQPSYAALGDLNGDGKPDMAVTEEHGETFPGQIEVLLGNGNGTFGTATAYDASVFEGVPQGGSIPSSIAMADMNADGNLDLLYLNSNWGTVAIAAGAGDGTVAAPVEFTVSEFPWGMALVDLTNDGTTDLLVGDDDGGGFDVLLNDNTKASSPNYSIGAQTPSQSVTSGSSATYTLNLVGVNGYQGTITFSCGNLPTGATCSFSPSSVVAKGAEPLTTTLTVSTTASASAALLRPGHPTARHESTILLASLSGMGLFALLLGSGKKRSIRIASAMMVLLLLGALVGCSGTSSGAKSTGGGTPAGSYIVTVNSTGSGTGAPTHSTNLTLVVQ